jgi:hypothetical protein
MEFAEQICSGRQERNEENKGIAMDSENEISLPV